MINRSMYRANHLSIIHRSEAHWHYYATFIDPRYRLSNTLVLQWDGATSCHYIASWYTGWQLQTGEIYVYASLSYHVSSSLTALCRITWRSVVSLFSISSYGSHTSIYTIYSTWYIFCLICLACFCFDVTKLE